MRWRVLNMAETEIFPGVFDPLKGMADVTSLAAQQATLRDRIGDFEAYFASLKVQANRQVLQQAKRLRVIATPSTGLDHIDLAAAKDRGIAIVSLKEDTAFLDGVTATAELAWGLLLSVLRRLPWATAAAMRGEWARDRFRGTQLSAKTLGILGYGRLGRMVAEYGKAFRMRVLACDVRDVKLAPGIERVDFDTLLRQSDVLSIHVHLSEETRGLIDAPALAKIKPTAVLINTSRGAVIEEAALLEALETGRIAGAGLDVICGEWDANLAAHPLVKYANSHENLVISPHIGGVTFESQRMALDRTVMKLKAFMETADANTKHEATKDRKKE